MHFGIKFLAFGKAHVEFLCDGTGYRVDSFILSVESRGKGVGGLGGFLFLL